MADSGKHYDGKVHPEDGVLYGEVAPGGDLERELWRRRQDRRDAERADGLPEEDAAVIPLVLSLARLAAQRDVRARFRQADTEKEQE